MISRKKQRKYIFFVYLRDQSKSNLYFVTNLRIFFLKIITKGLMSCNENKRMSQVFVFYINKVKVEYGSVSC